MVEGREAATVAATLVETGPRPRGGDCGIGGAAGVGFEGGGEEAAAEAEMMAEAEPAATEEEARVEGPGEVAALELAELAVQGGRLAVHTANTSERMPHSLSSQFLHDNQNGLILYHHRHTLH